MIWCGQKRYFYWLYGLVWVALVATYLMGPLAHLDDYAWDYDEGVYLQAAALAHAGYSLYSEVTLNKPPLLTWLLGMSFSLGGTTLQAARLTVLGLTLIGFLLLGALAEQWWGRWSGPAAMALFLMVPEIPLRAAVVMNDLPAMSAGFATLVSGMRYWSTRKRPWLILCAGAYAATIAFHPLLASLLIPVVLILATGHIPFSHWRRDVIQIGLIAIALVILMGLAGDWREMARWVVIYSLLSPNLSGETWKIEMTYLAQHWEIVALAIIGAGLLLGDSRRRPWIGVAAAWFLTTSLIVGLIPRNHYLVFLLPPLVVLGGGGVVAAARSVTPWRWALLVSILVPLASLTASRVMTPVDWPAWTTPQMMARTFLEREKDGDFVVSDDPFLAFAAGYLVPPSLADTSFKRIAVGWLDGGEVIEALLQHDASLLLFGSDRFAHLPGLRWWAETYAVEQRTFGPIRVYRMDVPLEPAHRFESRLGQGLHLLGYTLSGVEDIQTTSSMTVTLFWKRVGPVDGTSHTFVHLCDASDRLWTQHDIPLPMSEVYPAGGWPEGLLVPDPHSLQIPTDMPPGTYRLWVGVYRWPSLERLPAFRPDGTRWPDDRILLTEVTLSPAP